MATIISQASLNISSVEFPEYQLKNKEVCVIMHIGKVLCAYAKIIKHTNSQTDEQKKNTHLWNIRTCELSKYLQHTGELTSRWKYKSTSYLRIPYVIKHVFYSHIIYV